FFFGFAAPRDLHSFPTRRSSDLDQDSIIGEFAPLGLGEPICIAAAHGRNINPMLEAVLVKGDIQAAPELDEDGNPIERLPVTPIDRKSTRLNSSHVKISYAVFCL